MLNINIDIPQLRAVGGSILDGVFRIFQLHYRSGRTMDQGVDSAWNRNEYQVYFLGVKAADV
jgi:hypothetical protein